MGLLYRNKRKMKYSLFQGEEDEYAVKESIDDYIYDIVDGVEVPRVIGSVVVYSEPVDFLGTVTFSGGESEAMSYGVSTEDYDCKLTTVKGEIPIDETSLIFIDSEPEYDKAGRILKESADYRVVKKRPSKRYDNYLLKGLSHHENIN